MNREVRILIVEDDRELTKLFEDWQKYEWNLRVDYAATLSEGIEKLHSNHLDALLLDLNLPDSQGIATLKAIKKEAGGISVVIFSGLGDEAIERECIENGADGFLAKGNTSLEEALKAISRAGIRHQERLKLQADSELWRQQAVESRAKLEAMIRRHKTDFDGWIKDYDASLERLMTLGARAKT